ncbi:hypothetical protein K1X09_00420 [Paenibacillus lautus]|nr:hypothetical protein [Paenibacillus lautus]
MIQEEIKEYSPSYWEKRSNMMYYQYIKYMVQALAADANSLIDVGSSNAEYIESFDWISKRNTLDIENPYSSLNVEGIKADFLQFKPLQKYDFITCLQVLEHVPDVISFARKLFEIGDNVLISVPYMWEANSCAEHIHDPIDFDKLYDWIGRVPDYHIIVQEPLFNSSKSRRLICYYHSTPEKLSLNTARKNVLKRLNSNKATNFAAGPLLTKLDGFDIQTEMIEIKRNYELLHIKIDSFVREQKIQNNRNLLNRELSEYRNELNKKKKLNLDYCDKIDHMLRDINDIQRRIKLANDKKNKYVKEYKSIIN